MIVFLKICCKNEIKTIQYYSTEYETIWNFVALNRASQRKMETEEIFNVLELKWFKQFIALSGVCCPIYAVMTIRKLWFNAKKDIEKLVKRILASSICQHEKPKDLVHWPNVYLSCLSSDPTEPHLFADPSWNHHKIGFHRIRRQI